MRMRTTIFLSAMAVLVIAAGVIGGDASIGWFDYKNCDFCKQMAAQPGLVAHTRDECVNVSNGIVWITYIDKNYRAKYDIARKAEDSIVAAWQAGKPVNMCEYCKQIGGFVQKGVHMEGAPAGGVALTLYTSPDSTTVQELQAFGQKAIAESAKANAKFSAEASAGKK